MVTDRLPTLADYLSVLRRRKWIIAVIVALTTASATLFSARQESLYSASAQVLLNQSAKVSQSGSGITSEDQARYDATQALLAQTFPVARLALASAQVRGVTPAQLLAATTVTADPTADVLTFSVTDHTSQRAVQLANSYARAFVPYQNGVATRSIRAALKSTQTSLDVVTRELRTAGHSAGSAVLSSRLSLLAAQEQNLQSLLALQQGGSVVSELAADGTQTQPKNIRNLLIGVGVGVLLGVALAFLIDALDTRVRGVDEIASYLSLPLLGRIATPPRKVRTNDNLVMMSSSHDQSEAFRRLRVSIDMANLQARAKSLMVTSSVGQEGKTTTASNLAVAFALTGRRVILVDFDLRKPGVGRFFGLGNSVPGVTDVVMGDVAIADALIPVVVTGSSIEVMSPSSRLAGAEANGGGAYDLKLLLSGAGPPNPAEFVEGDVVPELLGELADQADIVIVDTAPILPVSDTISLSRHVDAALVVVHATLARRRVLAETRAALDVFPGRVLGFVETASDRDRGRAGARYGYGSGYGYGHSRPGGDPEVRPAQSARLQVLTDERAEATSHEG
jgi:Mrp family chromosome partitioning ATPase/capsular polysaccharide biosynthesis protein